MKITEDAVFLISLLFVILAYHSFQRTIGISLALLMFGTYLFILRDKRQEIFIEKIPNKLKSVMVGLMLWIGSLIGTSIIARILNFFIPSIGFGKTTFTMVLQSVVNVQQSMSSMIFSEALPLAGNIILTMVAIGVFFPINETFFAGVLYEKLKEKIGTRFGKVGIKSIAAIGFIGVMFVLYHIGAKGISDRLALLSVFVFFFLTIVAIIYERQMLGSIFGHMINNMVALAIFYGLFTVGNVSALIIFIGIVAFIFFFSLEKTNFRIVKSGG